MRRIKMRRDDTECGSIGQEEVCRAAEQVFGPAGARQWPVGSGQLLPQTPVAFDHN